LARGLLKLAIFESAIMDWPNFFFYLLSTPIFGLSANLVGSDDFRVPDEGARFVTLLSTVFREVGNFSELTSSSASNGKGVSIKERAIIRDFGSAAEEPL
jgi:hypothetical protein